MDDKGTNPICKTIDFEPGIYQAVETIHERMLTHRPSVEISFTDVLQTIVFAALDGQLDINFYTDEQWWNMFDTYRQAGGHPG